MDLIPQELKKGIALTVIWHGICHECEGGAFRDDFREGRQKVYDYDQLCYGLRRYDYMLYGIELACGQTELTQLVSRLVKEAIRECSILRAEML